MSQFSTFGQFFNFVNNTRQARVTEANKIVNLLMSQNRLLDHLKRGDKGGIKTLPSIGTELRDTLKVRRFSNFQGWTPGDDLTPTSGDEDQPIIVPHFIALANRKINKFQVQANVGSSADQVRFKNFRDSMMMGLWTDFVENYNGILWNPAESSTMDVRSPTPGQKMLSVPVFITESGRLPPGAGGGLGGWTTGLIEQLSPVTFDSFHNKVSRYDAAQFNNPEVGIVRAFDRMVRLTKFFTPSIKAELIAEPGKAMESKQIWTNGPGHDKIKTEIRRNLTFMTAQGFDIDLGEPTFHGVKIRWEPQLDVQPLDVAGAVPSPIASGEPGLVVADGTYSGAIYPADEPRYFFIDTTELKVCAAEGMWLEEETVKGAMKNWDSFAVIVSSVANMMAWDRRKCGICVPI